MKLIVSNGTKGHLLRCFLLMIVVAEGKKLGW